MEKNGKLSYHNGWIRAIVVSTLCFMPMMLWAEGQAVVTIEKDDDKAFSLCKSQKDSGSKEKEVWKFTLSANMNYGYQFDCWKVTSTSGDTKKSSFTSSAQNSLMSDNTQQGTSVTQSFWALSGNNSYKQWGFIPVAGFDNTYTVTAYSKARPVEFALGDDYPHQTAGDAPSFSWSNLAEQTQTITFRHAYALDNTYINTVTPSAPITITSAYNNVHTAGDGVGKTDGSWTNPGTYGVLVTFKPTAAELVAGVNAGTIKHGENSVNIQVKGKDDTNTATQTLKYILDLTPTFILDKYVCSFTSISSQTIKPTAEDKGELPFKGCVTWSYTLTGNNGQDLSASYTVVQDQTTGALTITPTADKAQYAGKVTITATCAGQTVTSDPCKVDFVDASTPLTLDILQGGASIVGKTLSTEILENTASQTLEYDVTFSNTTNWDGATVTFSNNPSNAVFTFGKTADKLKITVHIATAQEITTDVTVTAAHITDAAQTITETFTLTAKRWYSDITLSGAAGDRMVTLTWPRSPYATEYEVYQDGQAQPIATIAQPASGNLSYEVKNLLSNKDYTFQVRTLTGQSDAASTNFRTNVLAITTPMPSVTDANDTKLENAGVDFSAAFQDGEAIMDVLYILDAANNLCYIYDVRSDKSGYTKRQKDLNPTTQRVGRIDGTNNSIFYVPDPDDPTKQIQDNKRIYITGTCENLFWNSNLNEKGSVEANAKDHYMGWMQTVDCNIYLDNVRLQAARIVNIPETELLIDINKSTDNNGTALTTSTNLQDSIWKGTINTSASVFYLPDGKGKTDNTTTIHLRGNNYLGGGVGKTYGVCMYFEISASGQHMYLWPSMGWRTPNYCAPIAIKDASLFDDRLFTNGNTEYASNRNDLRADPYNVPSLPNITCKFDAVWVDGKVVDGYVDLSTRSCQSNDIIVDVDNNGLHGNGYNQQEWKFTWTFWVNYVGYRYTPALVTGGHHGKFVIDGARVNLWPANGAAKDMYYYGVWENWFQTIEVDVEGGHYANYLACGSNRWEMYCDESLFKKSSSTITNIISKWNDPAPPFVTIYGAGQGQPVGTLEINGGTITANTDPNSFAVRYGDKDGKPQKNIDQDGTDQPLLGPKNLTITGGTFQTPIYATTKHGIGNGTEATKWTDAVTDADKKNGVNKAATPQALSLVDIPMSAANTDYSKYAVDIRESSALTPNNDEVGYIVNVGTADEYQYGMANVWSDKNAAMCHFYLPTEKGAFYRNYWVQSGEKLTALDKPAYNITVDAGGEITATDVFVPGRIAYRPNITEGLYQTISMPFTVEKMYAAEPDGNFYFTGFAEDRDNPTIDNSIAYAYIYHMDDGNGNPYSLAADERFKDYYHTHADGLMQKGKTYVMKFPDYGGYFEDNQVTLLGTKGQTINASSDYIGIDAMRPTANNTFALVGNATFMTQNFAAESVYLLNQTDNSFHINDNQTTLAPLQGVVLANELTSRKVRVLGKPLVTTDLGNTLAGATIIGSDDKIVVIPAAQMADVHVYTADGQLVGTYTAAEGTPTLIPATAGVYMVRIADSVTKVLVY